MYKIKISETNELVIELKEWNDESILNIYKTVYSDRYTGISSNAALAFNLEQANLLNSIVQSIDANDYKIQEYGIVERGSKIYKIFIGSFKGNNSFHIRERVESKKYTGFGKKGISFSVDKIGEFQEILKKAVIDFNEGKINTKTVKGEGYSSGNIDDEDINSYF